MCHLKDWKELEQLSGFKIHSLMLPQVEKTLFKWILLPTSLPQSRVNVKLNSIFNGDETKVRLE